MRLYNVLIADDELALRRGLVSMIDWEAEGFTVAGTVKDGVQALAFIEKTPVDFVITDLKMPNMDGMELVEKLVERSFNGFFLILTNYSDFKMAVQSFRSGAVDYILKATIRPEEMCQHLRKVRALLDEKYVQTSEQQDLAAIQTALEQGQEIPALTSICRGLGFVTDRKASTELQEALVAALAPAYHLVSNEDGVMLFFCTGEEEVLDSQQLEALLVNGVLCVCADGLFTGDEIRRFRDSCRNAAPFLYYGGIRRIFSQKDISEVGKGSGRMYLDLLMCFRMHFDAESYREGVAALRYKLRSIAAIPLAPESARILEPALLAALTECCIYFEEHKGLFESIQSRSKKSAHLSDRLEILEELAERISNLPYIGAGDHLRREVAQVMSYVHDHMASPLTLTTVAKHVNMNESYLSRLFKKETGCTLFGYFNIVRLRRAMTLLRGRDCIIKDVVDTLHYGNQSYFNKVFKKYCCMNPADYRKLYSAYRESSLESVFTYVI